MTRVAELTSEDPAGACRAFVRAAATGTGGSLVLEAAAPSAVSPLIDALVATAATVGMTVVHAPPTNLATAVSDQLLARLGVAAPPPMSRLDTPLVVRSRLDARQYLVVESIVEAVELLLATTPVLLLVEDAARLDGAALAALRSCVTISSRSALAVVTTEIGELQRDVLDAFALRLDATRLVVPGIGPVGVDSAACAGDVELCLRVAAAAGTRVDPETMGVLLDIDERDLRDTLEAACRAGVLVRDGDDLTFADAAVRRAWAERIPVSIRAAVHHEIADHLVGRGAPDEVVAAHALRAARAGDADLAAVLVRAGSALVADAPQLARRYLVRADEIGAARDLAESLALTSGLAEVGELDRSLIRLAQLAAHTEGAALAEVQALRAQLLAMRGDPSGEALDLLGAAIATAEDDRALAVLVLGDASVLHLESGDFARAAATARRALDLARGIDEPWRATDAWCTCAWLAMFALDLDEAWDCAERAMEAAATGGGVAHRRSAPEFFAGLVLLDWDRLDDAAVMFDRARLLAEREGAAWAVPLAMFGQAYTAFAAGQWDDALALCESGLAMAAEIGSLLGVGFGGAIAAIIELERDHTEVGRQWLERAREGFGPGVPSTGTDTMMLAEVMLLEADRDLDGAHALLGAAFEIDHGLGMLNDLGDFAPYLVRLARQRRDPSLLEAARAVFDELAPRYDRPALHGAAARVRAVLDGDVAAAFDAVGAARRRARPYELALTLADAALVAAGAGDDRSSALLEEATALLDGLGARRALLRAHAEARAAGMAPRRRSGRGRRAVGWDALTTTEREVVTLVREGLTSRAVGERLFISRRTVETHLQHVYTKLAVRSRHELVALAAGSR